jgi:hypothetical protein
MYMAGRISSFHRLWSTAVSSDIPDPMKRTSRNAYTYKRPIMISPLTLAVIWTSTAMSSLMLICKLGSFGLPSAVVGNFTRPPTHELHQ